MNAQQLSPETSAAVVALALEAGTVRAQMHGNSMLPDLVSGMLLEVRKTARPKIGDIAVFRGSSRLVAHRVVRVVGDTIVCSGDAQPDCVEYVERPQLVGCVTAIYDAAGRRIDGLFFRLRGMLRARSHRIRAFARSAVPWLRRRTYATLVEAVAAAIRCDGPGLAKALHGASPEHLSYKARRHRCAPLLATAAAGIKENTCAAALSRTLRKDLWRASLQCAAVREQAIEVVRILRSAGIEPVLLKGAARLLAGTPEATLYEPVDIDILVGRDEVERASHALLAAGYAQGNAPESYSDHHHAAPLYRNGGVPVEIHHALRGFALSLPHTAADMKRFVVPCGDDERFNAFDAVGTALHLAIHCLRRPALRDIALLAQHLSRMDEYERQRFSGIVARETRYGIALNAALYLAARMTGIRWHCDARVVRYARWMLVREDLPRPLRARTGCVDAWLASDAAPLKDSLTAAFGERSVPLPKRIGRGLALVAGSVAGALYARFMRE